jgi:Restriction endonuclease
MPQEPGTIGLLHEVLFGFIPSGPGTAYERLTAIVLAALGWTEVRQQAHEQPEGVRAKQTLDVVARHPSGEQRRLIVQCKHYAETVGKEVMDTLVGIGVQLGDVDLAIVTTVGFTAGARDVAVDRDIAMVRLRPYDPVQDEGQFIRRIVLTLNVFSPPIVTDFRVEVGEIEGDVVGGQFSYNTFTPLQRDDGSATETLAEIIEANSAGMVEGEFDRRVAFSERRWLPVEGGPAGISCITWHERIARGEPSVSVIESDGDPVLVVQQLDEKGEIESGRLVVDRQLWAWDLDADNNDVPRGQLDRLE